MSKILERMKATLEKKKRVLRNIQQDVASFERVIAYYEQHLDELEVKIATPDEVKNKVEEILADQMALLHYKTQLFPMLGALGVEIAGQDQPRNLGAYLSADKRFNSFGDGLWGLSKWKEGQPQSPSENGHNNRPTDIKVG